MHVKGSRTEKRGFFRQSNLDSVRRSNTDSDSLTPECFEVEKMAEVLFPENTIFDEVENVLNDRPFHTVPTIEDDWQQVRILRLCVNKIFFFAFSKM